MPDSVPADHPDHGTDWSAIAAMTDDEIMAAASADPDAQPLTDAQLARARRVGLAGAIRFRLGVTPETFEARYGVPVETLLAWERGTETPDAAAKAYLAIIDADPAAVAALRAKVATRPRKPVAAE